MAVRSDSLALGSVTIPGAGFAVLYTVPTDRTTILKDARLYVTGTNGPVALVVADGADLALIHRIPAPTDALVSSPEPPPWVVMREGFEIQLHGDAGLQTVYYVLSGAVLEGDPS